jgi:hypothetical protein
MMKKIVSFLVLFAAIGSFAQDGVDPRLLAYHGEKIVNLYETNREVYDKILYRLDNSFYIIEKKQFKGSEAEILPVSAVKSNDGTVFTPDLLNDPGTFNFMLYNFRVSQTAQTVYDLGDGRLMIFYSLNEINDNYSRGIKSSNNEKTGK